MRVPRWLFLGVQAACMPGCFADPIDSAAGGTTTESSAEASTADSSGSGPEPQDSSSTGSTTSDSVSSSGQSTTGEPSGTSTSAGSSTMGEGSSESTSGSSTGAASVCGDDVLDPDEACDGEALDGASCEAFGFAGGTLECSDDCSFGFEECVPPEGMVFVPPGAFEMGSTDAADEQPIRDVTLSGYFIDATEVTAEAYAACVAAAFCQEPMSTANQQFDEECNYGRKDRLDHPVNCTGYDQAAAYCNWAEKHLPTEAQWERAARWTDARRYPWGDTPAPNCLYAVMDDGGVGCGDNSTSAVMTKPAGVSEDGLYDMSGNVWEWVADFYGEYEATETTDPTGPAIGAQRIVRGGGWFQEDAGNFTTTHRHEVESDLSDAFIGFRCARALEQP